MMAGPGTELTMRHKALATLALALLAVAGNVLSVPLFFSVVFIFGSVAAMLAVALLGTLPAVLVAAAAGLYTVVLWGHPYALIIFTVEALVERCAHVKAGDTVLVHADVGAGGVEEDFLLRGDVDFIFGADDVQPHARENFHAVVLRLNLHRTLVGDELHAQLAHEQAQALAHANEQALDHADVGLGPADAAQLGPVHVLYKGRRHAPAAGRDHAQQVEQLQRHARQQGGQGKDGTDQWSRRFKSACDSNILI